MPRTKADGSKTVKEQKPPELYMIATIFNNKKQLIGARLIDINDKKKKTSDVSINSCINVLKSNPLAIKNIRLESESGQLRLVNGAIHNLTKIDANGKPMEGVNFNGSVVAKTPILIVNQISNLGYTVLNYKGEMRKVAIDKLLDEIKVVGIANGTIVYKPELNMDFIVGIEEPYEVLEISKSKVGASGMAKIRMAMPGHDTSTVAKNASIDIENQINYTDVFQSLNPGQKKCVQNYYMWYTVDMYRSLAKTTKFELNLAKAEKLAQLREDKNWEFGGIVDSYTTGLMGQSKCSLGHNIRYEYHAVVFDAKGDVTDRIIFGETCSSDFFSISVEDMRKLVKVRKKMSEEIEILTEAVTNNLVDELWNGVKLLKECVIKLGPELTEKVFGEKVGKTLLNYINFNVPFPESLVKLARAVAYGGIKKEDSNGSKFWCTVFPEYKGIIEDLYKKNKSAHRYYDNKVIGVFCEYLDFMCYNKLDGVYAYDPFLKTGKGEGGFNAKTREERSTLLRGMKSTVLCQNFTLEELQNLLESMSLLNKGYQEIIRLYPDASKDINKFREDALSLFSNTRVLEAIVSINELQLYLNRFCYYLVIDDNLKYYYTYRLGDRLDRIYNKELPRYTDIKSFKNSLINFKMDFSKFGEYAKKVKEIEDNNEKLKEEAERRYEQERKERQLREEKEKYYKQITKTIEDKIGTGLDVEDSKTYMAVFKDDFNKTVYKIDQLLIILTYKESDNILCVTNKCGKYTIKKVEDYKKSVEELSNSYYESLSETELKEMSDFCDKLRNEEKDAYINSIIVDEKVTSNAKVEELLKGMNIIQINKIESLKEYFTKNNINSVGDLEEYYDKICYDICTKDLSYDKLSYKQKHVIDKSYEKLIENKQLESNDKKDDNKMTDRIMQKVNFILSNTDTNTELGAKIAEAVNQKDKIGINICKTVKRTGKASDKQIKHINTVFELVKRGGGK